VTEKRESFYETEKREKGDWDIHRERRYMQIEELNRRETKSDRKNLTLEMRRERDSERERQRGEARREIQ